MACFVNHKMECAHKQENTNTYWNGPNITLSKAACTLIGATLKKTNKQSH